MGDDALRIDPALTARGLDVLEVLGAGGSSIVYRARDTRHDRDVAIKIQRPDAPVVHSTERFAREIRVAAGLRHRNILPLFDSGVLRDGRLFAVMPLAHGRPLRAMIAEGPLATADALRLTEEIAEALEYLHRSGYVHRDVKPENILVESGHAVLTDFGIASSIAGARASMSPARVAELWQGGGLDHLTDTAQAVGTLRYMSPEALSGEDASHVRRDLYALGLVLYEMLAGELPAHGPLSAPSTPGRSGRAVPSVRVVRPDVSPDVDAFIARCTAPDPADRFVDATALLAALRGVSTVASRTVMLPSMGQEAPWSLGLIAALLVLTVGIAWWSAVRHGAALDPSRVVIADLANDSGDSTLSALGSLAGDLITAEISARTALTAVNATFAVPSRQQRHLVPADSILASRTRALVAASNAGIAVTGAYFREGRDLDFVAEVTDTRSGRVLGVAGPIRAAPSHVERALRALGDSVASLINHRHDPPGG